MQLQSFKQLIVWQRSIELVKEIYKVTDEFPKSELYGLTSQMRRASISIPSNIAEGYKRKNLGEYLQFLSIADASAAELETQLIISKDLYTKIDFFKAQSLLEEVQKMLVSLIRKLNPKPSTLNPKLGFTMVELLVAMSLFLVTISIATGTFIQTLRGQRTTVAVIAANNNASLTLEQMAREIRTGTKFSKSGDDLEFTNARGEQVVYHWNSDAGKEILEKSVDGGASFKPLTAENVRVKRASFILFKGDEAEPFPARVTVLLGVGAVGLPFSSSVINLQMTVSGRTLE